MATSAAIWALPGKAHTDWAPAPAPSTTSRPATGGTAAAPPREPARSPESPPDPPPDQVPVSATSPEQPSGFVAYVDTGRDPGFQPVDAMRRTGADWFLLGHLTSGPDGCAALWSGKMGHSGDLVIGRLGGLRTAGGDAGVSFGGASGTDPAVTCKAKSRVASAYRSVLGAFDLTHLDFEPREKPSLPVAKRRAGAVAALQKEATAAHRPLWVSFSLPATRHGLSREHRALLRATRQAGARIDTVNLITPLKPGGLRGVAAAVRAAAPQIGAALALDHSTVWRHLGVTPVLSHPDALTPAGARTLAAYAERHHLTWLSLRGATPDDTITRVLTAPTERSK
ncbi:hypothetical protein [Sinosporangium album]|nr:hypothetical protein [Sinosporangium album]